LDTICAFASKILRSIGSGMAVAAFVLGRTAVLTATAFARAHRHAFVLTTMTLVLALWTLLVLAAWLAAGVFTGLPDEKALRGVGAMAQATTIYDAHDRPVFSFFKEYRIEVPLSRISPHLIDAILAVEDQRFFEHGGVDVIRVAGAAWGNVRNGWGTQGGSTITQQVARQSFLTSEKTLRRKLKEVVVASRLEKEFDKRQILEWYLNKVYFGDGLYGVEAASLGYFGKHASELDVAEAALLAGLVKAPSSYAPTVSVERSLARRRITLNAMRHAGMIDTATYAAADGRDLNIVDRLRTQDTDGQYFKEEVRKQLVQQFGAERVYEGGLKVYTTMDPDLQRTAEEEVLRAVRGIEARQARARGVGSGDEALQGALVALDPSTGEVRALVGGRSFDESPFNRATQSSRQAGSAFKPFVYAAALERGYTPATLITGLSEPIKTLEGAWLPDDHSGGGPMTMRTALRLSSNSAAVGTLMDIGIPSVIHAAERFGIESVPGVPSLALGSGEVTLLAMTAAYAAFANAGMRPQPLLIRRVETADGEVLFSAQPRAERAVSETTAFLMTTMLADVLNGGTGSQARRFGFTRPAAGKTGTTNGYRDAWFIGYTPRLAAGVWIGYDYPRTIAARGYAGTLAAPLWGRFMTSATRNEELTTFRRPRSVTSVAICRISGKRATEACRHDYVYDSAGYPTARSSVYTEYFARGTEPVEYCDASFHSYVPLPGTEVVSPVSQPPTSQLPTSPPPTR
jgi:1A family penicillin-binding protein